MTQLMVASNIMDSLKTAGIHTAIGMGLTFAVLLLMIFIISLFRYLPNPDAPKAVKKEEPAQAPVAAAPVAAPAPVVEQTSLTDDLELVAVITAAIAAASGTGTDGFVVRSIRRAKTTSNWKKA